MGRQEERSQGKAAPTEEVRTREEVAQTEGPEAVFLGEGEDKEEGRAEGDLEEEVAGEGQGLEEGGGKQDRLTSVR